MSKETNLEALTRFAGAVNTGNWDLMNEAVSPDNVDHDPAAGQVQGPQGYISFFKQLRTAFPDLKVELVHMVADEDNIAIAYELSGTHQGEFQGIPPTNNPIKARGLQISKFKNGVMIERWGSSDQLGILKQIGQELK
ncbi:ester cyclase [Mucilaginibacter sabulilitoris]|uniref:Ester cyclase n=1 Tax=Mucilaginibacter sabulilitoris TaxID=1173583 RepID=A0ABZ0TH66_9SPHI|nr:ester cyclase [Mucilaginibacter sabulilitoris]WPU91578.1 ester cyclase [Mucilaginibacter sabulilitoris]